MMRNAIKLCFVRYIIVIKRLQILFVTVALAFGMDVRAQYDPLFSHYYDMETSFNPAAAGKEAKLNINVAYATAMSGFESNPQTAYASGDMPVKIMNAVHGFGAQFQNDKIGMFNHMRLAVQYSYRKKLFGGLLNAGVQVGMITEKFKGSAVEIDGTDPVFTKQDLDGNALDVGLGFYYRRKQWYAGISAQHLTAPVVELGERNELKIERSYYATVGYAIPFRSPNLQLMTSAIGRTDMKAWRADVTARLLYTNDTKRMYGGLSYSPTNSVTVLFGMNIKGINFGYSYECYTNGLNPGNGSHELCVGYEMDINLGKKGRNLHKSVRLL